MQTPECLSANQQLVLVSNFYTTNKIVINVLRNYFLVPVRYRNWRVITRTVRSVTLRLQLEDLALREPCGLNLLFTNFLYLFYR